MILIERYDANKKKMYNKNQQELHKTADSLLHGKHNKAVKDFEVKFNNAKLRGELEPWSTPQEVAYDLKHGNKKVVCLLEARFMKDPTRQNISEMTQLEHLNARGFKITKMNANGQGSERISNGKLVKDQTKKNTKGSKTCTKSIDFLNERTGERLFAKVTQGYGGGQDNQYEDVEIFIRQASLLVNSDRRHKYCILVDGDYYTPQKLTHLSNLIPKHLKTNIRICNSDTYND